MSRSIPKPPHFEALTDEELKQFGVGWSTHIFDPEVKPLHDDLEALKDNYQRLRQHHILETEWLWNELEKVRPGITRTLRKPPS